MKTSTGKEGEGSWNKENTEAKATWQPPLSKGCPPPLGLTPPAPWACNATRKCQPPKAQKPTVKTAEATPRLLPSPGAANGAIGNSLALLFSSDF